MAQNLSIGMSGPDVRLNQQALNKAGGSTLPRLAEDGIFGPKTHARVIEFQRTRGLKADGVIGPMTRAALGTAAGVPGAPPPSSGATPGGNVVGTVVSSISPAVASWKATARLQGVIISGLVATGPRGCLVGPPLAGFMLPKFQSLQGDDRATAIAAANGISAAFERWRQSASVPGLPWYPAFVAFPGPIAPPTPNVPSPLLALASAGMGELTPSALQNAMSSAADPATRSKSAAAFAQIAAQAAGILSGQIAASLVRNALGTGPIPSFAPPFVPVGPVVNGSVLPNPGVLS